MPGPSDRHNALVPALLAVAAVALVVPWTGAAARVATGAAALAVLAAFGRVCWDLGRSEQRPCERPDLTPLLDRLDRIGAALESRPIAQPAQTDPFSGMASAIAEGRWADAEAMLAEHPDHPEAPRHAERVAAARLAAGEALRGELKAAQEVNDPARVLEVHAGLVAVLTAEALAEIEAGVSKWFLSLIMRRLRGGTVGPDVAELAAKVAERFPRSVEGASLRASLATLRRSAGLCPRCARPYKGIADACPVCLGAAPAVEDSPAKSPWSDESAEEEDLPAQPSPDGLDGPVFLDDPT